MTLPVAARRAAGIDRSAIAMLDGDGGILIVSAQEFEKFEAEAATGTDDSEVDARLASACAIEVDGRGRTRLPEHLRDLVGLRDQAVVDVSGGGLRLRRQEAAH